MSENTLASADQRPGPERKKLTPAVFDLDLAAAVPAIERFIAAKMKELGRHGIVVPLSGGLDSSTVTALCARAVGPELVTALLLPDRLGAPDALSFGRMVAASLGVNAVEVDATELNQAAGVYDFIGYKAPRLFSRLARFYLSHTAENSLAATLRGRDSRVARSAQAAVFARQRVRMVMTYRYADLHQLLVVGAAHKSEDLLGAFVKFGVDDCADLMPLKGLYRSHILAIARAVGVPDAVLARSPNPEMLPGVEDKYLDLFKIPAPTADLVLWGIEHGLSDADIARDASVEPAKVAELREVVRLSAHMREPSQFPDLGAARAPA